MADKLVIYDSVFGNTEKIAKAIGEALGADTVVKQVSEVSSDDIEGVKFLFVGSPTRVFNSTPAVKNYLKTLPGNSLAGVKSAAFDTRIPIDQTDSGFLKFMIKLFSYADVKIEKGLKSAGATLALPSGGFGVSGTEGPLIEGELERAQQWAKGIL